MQAYGSRRRLPELSQQKSPSLRDCLHTGTSFTRGTTPIPAVSAGIFGRVTCGITAQPTFHVQPCGSGAKLNLLPEPWMLPADDIHSLLENRDLKHLLRLFLLFFRYVHLNHPFLKSQALLLLFFFAAFFILFFYRHGVKKQCRTQSEKCGVHTRRTKKQFGGIDNPPILWHDSDGYTVNKKWQQRRNLHGISDLNHRKAEKHRSHRS